MVHLRNEFAPEGFAMITIRQPSLRQFVRRMRSSEFPLAVIVGAQRSGTTWLQLLCAAHPRLAGGEESHLFSHYLGNLNNQYYADYYSQEKLPRPQGLPCYVTMDRWTALMREMAVSILEPLLEAKPQAKLVVEKTPDHVKHLAFIRQLFPQCRIVHVVRDARDVVVSQIEASRRKWGEDWAASDATEAASRWAKWVESARQFRKPASLYHEVRYENLISDGAQTLQEVFRFLGVPLPTPAVEAIYNQFPIEACRDDTAPQVLLRLGESGKKPAAPTAAGFFRTGQAGGWRSALSDEDRSTVESVAGNLLRELGYETASHA